MPVQPLSLTTPTQSRRRLSQQQQQQQQQRAPRTPKAKNARRPDHLFEFLRKFYVIRTTDHISRLDDRLRSNKTSAYANAGDFSVLRTPYPVASALCKRWFHTAVAILGVIYSVLFLLSLISNLDRGTYTAKCLKFSIPELRGGPATHAHVPVLHSIGLLTSRQCRSRLGVFDPGPAREYVFRSETEMTFNGFYLQKGNASSELDPAVFTLQTASGCASQSADLDWEVVGASRRHIKTDGYVEWFLEPYASPKDEEYSVLEVDFHHPWYFWLGNFLHRPCLALVSFFLCVIGTVQRPHLGSSVILVNLFVLLVGWSVFALMSIWEHQYRPAHVPLQWLHPLQALIMLAGFRWGERYTPEIAVFGGAWSTGYTVLEHFFMSEQSAVVVFDKNHLYGGLIFEAMLWVLLGAMMILLRRRAHTQSWKLIQADARTYREAWERLCRGEEPREALRRLETLCKLCPPPVKLLQLRLCEGEGEAPDGIPILSSLIGRRRNNRHIVDVYEGSTRGRRDSKQSTVSSVRSHSTPHPASNPAAVFIRLESQQSSASSQGSVEEGGRTPVRPVTSLDQLYVQAAGVHALLVQKVRTWGLKSKGRCRVEGSNEFVLWTDVRKGSLEKRVKVAVLKKTERAVEKVIRAYKGKVARLCDVCRESIYFERLDELVACLQEIRTDPDVVLLAVKNRYSLDYEDLKTAGYRDLNVNLRIVTEESEALGAHLHICELQLILTEFASLKTESGHKRYVAYRNALGE
mmetsp:Transcript_54157/g.126500  ORF Transcript_54157/g.126500 Transcript_54157/m.126500 type:complete len:748 (+) Transcript_54157:248-2491(+)